MQEVSSLKQSRKIHLGPFVAFFATMILYILLALVCRKYPLGNYSTSISDLQAQYAPFLAMYRGRMDSGIGPGFLSSLMYSFDMGLGGNYMATFGYYLASPFNLLFRFFDVSFINGFVLLLMVLKMSFASAFMCMFMELRAESTKKWYPVLFGIVYGFSSYAMAFLFQIMWLDGYMLLPLLLYFTEQFIRKDRKAGFIVTLLFVFFSNFYIAYMVGIFSFLYLVARMFYLGMFKDIRKGIVKVIRFGIMAVLDALILCIFLVPTGIATLTNSDPTVTGADSHFVLYDLTDIVDHFFVGVSGEFGDVMPSNLPWFFVSTLVTSLIILFFVTKKISVKDKIFYGLMLAGVYISTAIYWFDVAWQVMDSPNWFWHRHAFVFIPLFMIIASKVIDILKDIDKKEILISGGIVLGLLLFARNFGGMESDKTFLFNISMIVSFYIILFFMTRNEWSESFADMPKILPVLLAILTCFEVVYIDPLLSTDISTMTLFTGRADEYSESIQAMQDLEEVRTLAAVKNNAFRAENEIISDYGITNYLQEHPNMFGGFHGMAFFNSSSNKPLHRFIKQLGYAVNYNYFAVQYSYAAPDSDAFMSIGAITTMRDYSAGAYLADDRFDIGYHFYGNSCVLPLAFAADKGAGDFDFYQLEKKTEGKDYFAFRNLWYRSLFPESFTEDYFITLDDELVTGPVVTNGMEVNSDLTTMTELLREQDADPDDEDLPGDETDEVKDKDKLGQEDLALEEASKNARKFHRMNKDLPIYLEYTATAPATGEMYFNLSVPNTSGVFDIYVDNIFISHASEGTFFSQIFRLGTYNEGDEVKVTITSDSKSFTVLEAYFGYFDTERFKSQFDTVDTSKVTVDEVYDGYVKMTADIDDSRTVITTVPYEGGWTLYIDGQEAEIKPYQQAFISFDVPSGPHTCELKFIAPGFKTGAVMSAVGVAGMLVFVIIDGRKGTKKNRTPEGSPAPEKS
ncbi:membrane protein YfhO [Ruminococcaceae bacterium YRB3002]|nr:membrane protein YfhO [Ruminococcaceae bacterium YRB3002]